MLIIGASRYSNRTITIRTARILTPIQPESKTHEFKALPRNPVNIETTHFCGTITHNETKVNIPQRQMETNDGNLKHPENADPPKIVILQRPLTGNKQ